MEVDEKQNIASNYGEKKVQEMVMKRYKKLRGEGILQSLEDIYAKQPTSRIMKDNFLFTFDLAKNQIEEKMINQQKLQKILEKESKQLAAVEIRNFKEVNFQNEGQIYSQKLQSGLPIFKSILYMRYQSDDKWQELLGEEHAFLSDQLKLSINEIASDIPKIKLFLEDEIRLNKVHFHVDKYNELNVKDEKYPSLHQIEKRADVLAKLLLLSIYNEEHRKLKQAWKNDEAYQELLKNEKKMKSEIEPQKLKEGEQQHIDELMKSQVQKIMNSLEERANGIAHDLFKQHNGEKAIQTKKSLQKLIASIQAQTNPRTQLKMLVAYRQKKSW